MASNNVLRWKDGRGWLIRSGGTDAGSEIRAQALGRVAADGGVAYIGGEQAMADLEDLGAPAGYLVDVMAEDDQTIESQIGDAGMVVVGSDAPVDQLRSGLIGAAAQGMQTAFGNGAVILAEGWGAAVFGAWVALDSGELTTGLGWLEDGLIVPGATSLAESEPARDVLSSDPSVIVVGIGAGSALALGPDGEVETWGDKQVAIALGRNYSP
jgi:hypothetical protein